MTKQELENRLIDFAATIIIIASKFEKNYAGNHLSGQIIRSGTSPALNYGEAQSAESKKDFIHKNGNLSERIKRNICLFENNRKSKFIDRQRKFNAGKNRSKSINFHFCIQH